MLDLEYSNAFFDDLKKQNKSGFDREVLNNVVEILRNEQPLDQSFKDHALKFDYRGYRECHLKPNLLLIYKVIKNRLILFRIGSHQQLFKNY